jgi:uncharacterized membrane protein YidH (DUF202 family)
MKNEIVEKLVVLVTSAFGLVAALAWNDTIKLIITSIAGKPDSIWGSVIYALLVTVLAVVVTVYVSRLAKKE